jgi:hypothetical protein
MRRRFLVVPLVLVALAITGTATGLSTIRASVDPPVDAAAGNGCNTSTTTINVNGSVNRAQTVADAFFITLNQPPNTYATVPAGGSEGWVQTNVLEANTYYLFQVEARFPVSLFLFSGANCTFDAQSPGPVLLYKPAARSNINSLAVVGHSPGDKGAFTIKASSFATQADLPPDAAMLPQDYMEQTTTATAATGPAADQTPTTTALYTQWTFTEGSTRDGLRMFITLLSKQSQTVTINYFIDPGSPGGAGLTNPVVRTVDLPANQRVTVIANDPPTGGVGANLDFSTEIDGVAPFRAAAVLYSNRDVGLGSATNGESGIQGDHN